MLDGLKKQMMKWAGEKMKDFTCPKCGLVFSPFKERELTSWSDNIVCPQCAFEVPLKDSLQVQQEVKVNPQGPVEKPAQTKIERKVVSDTQLLFYIPASGRSGGLLFFAIVWNAISWTVFLGFLLGSHKGGKNVGTGLLIATVFPLIGFGLAYVALRMRLAVHLLYLSPDSIRLQRQFFGHRKNFDLATSRVVSVRKVQFYQQNYQPVYGVEIKSSDGKIRFGSVLTEEEKNWICWEIKEFIRPYTESQVI